MTWLETVSNLHPVEAEGRRGPAGGVALRELLRLDPLAGARVVGGAAGLDRRVRRVNVMEVPDILRWVTSDELLLTTAYPLRNDPIALAGLVPGLAERGLAGLAVKPARYIDTIPAAMVEAAERLSFPLIELPAESSFNEILTSVLTVILNVQAARLQRTAEIHERFTAIVLGGGGLRQIAEALADAVGRPVGIVDPGGALLTSSPGAERLGRVGRPLPGPLATEHGPHPRAMQLGALPVVVQPIQVGGERFGSIVVLEPAGELLEEQADALEYAATVAALRQVQARAVAEADHRFQAVCLEELVTGHVDGAVLMERASAFKWDLSLRRAVLIAHIDELGGRPFAQLAGTADELGARHRLADSARLTLGRTAIVWERSAEVASLVAVPAGHPEALADLARRLVVDASRAVPDATLSVGVGRPVDDPLRLATSYTEARRALDIGHWGRGSDSVWLFEDLGVDRLLAGLPDADLVDFADSMLRPLVEYDRHHRTDLVGTLEAYLPARNAALAARDLYVHYNTLKNRLRLISEILGPLLDDPDRCLAMALALRIQRLRGSERARRREGATRA